jgi:hypothetical protein
MHPEFEGAEPLPVGLASAPHVVKVVDELERCERVAGPGSGEEATDALRRGDDLEEEVEAGVAGVGVGGGVVLCAHQAWLSVGHGKVVGGVEASVEEVEEAERLHVGVSVRGERRCNMLVLM